MTKRLLCALWIACSLFGQAALAPDHADVRYGPGERNLLDLWLAKSDTPTPLILFIHGGGFVGGDKKNVSAANVRRSLAAGVSYAAINYRFRTEVPLQTVIRDCARALQFLRFKAKSFNIDKTKVAAMGGSAGAGTSLWLAFHDDLADSGNSDPVLRESTRIVAAAGTGTQATYDVFWWKEVVGEVVDKYLPVDVAPGLYGLATMEDVRGAKGVAVRADLDMLGLITKDDAPVYLTSSSEHDSLDSLGAIYHTQKHAWAIKKRCDEVGVPAAVKITSRGQGGADPVGFLLAELSKAR